MGGESKPWDLFQASGRGGMEEVYFRSCGCSFPALAVAVGAAARAGSARAGVGRCVELVAG